MFNKFALIARRGAVPHPHCFSRENRTGRARGTCSAGSEHVVGIGSRTNPRITDYERPEERTIHVWRACHACTGICWWGNPYNGWKWKGLHCIPRNDHWTPAVPWRPLGDVQGSESNVLLRISIVRKFCFNTLSSVI